MDIRTISVVALSNADYPSLSAKLAEASRWMTVAAEDGADLVVLPECLNTYYGDGFGSRQPPPVTEHAFDDWRQETSLLIETAQRENLWVVIPVIHRDDRGLWNSFFLVSPQGEAVWRYDKVSPTDGELDAGILPGRASFYDWRGVRLGGAICFDTCFPENLNRWAAENVQLGLVPSLWPGGSQLNHFCKIHASRVALSYPAWSRIIDVDGLEAAEGGYRNETLRFGFGVPVYTASLNFDRLTLYGAKNQDKMTDLVEKYGKRVRVVYDQGNCLWFLESRDPALNESDLQQEYGLITASEYFTAYSQNLHRFRQAAESADGNPSGPSTRKGL